MSSCTILLSSVEFTFPWNFSLPHFMLSSAFRVVIMGKSNCLIQSKSRTLFYKIQLYTCDLIFCAHYIFCKYVPTHMLTPIIEERKYISTNWQIRDKLRNERVMCMSWKSRFYTLKVHYYSFEAHGGARNIQKNFREIRSNQWWKIVFHFVWHTQTNANGYLPGKTEEKEVRLPLEKVAVDRQLNTAI